MGRNVACTNNLIEIMRILEKTKSWTNNEFTIYVLAKKIVFVKTQILKKVNIFFENDSLNTKCI
jgi:hypothetical protein